MWSSCPPLVPYHYVMAEPQANYSHHAAARQLQAAHHHTYASSSGTVGLQMVPFNANMAAVQPSLCDGRTIVQNQHYTLDRRRFFLDRSLYELVKASQCLESTDPKLLCWYLSLSTNDRKLIQDEGGLQQFLQRHPALEVRVRAYTCVNFDGEDHYGSHPATSTSTPTLNDAYSCLTCGEKLCPGDKCRYCTTPIQKETTSSPVRETDLLPSSVTDANLSWLEYCGGNGAEGASYHLERGQQQHATDAPAYAQDSFPKAYSKCPRYQLGPPEQHNPIATTAIDSQDSLWTVYNGSHLVKEPIRYLDMEAHASKVQLLSQLWDEASQKAYKDPSAQASFSLDMELDSRTTNPESADNRPAATQAPSVYCQYGETSMLSWTNEVEDNTTNTTTSGEEAASSLCESETEHFHSIMEQDESILECKMNARGVGGAASSAQESPMKVMVSIDALMGKTSTKKSSSAVTELKCSTAEKSTSPLPPVITREASVVTESNLASQQSAATETEGPPDTADKTVNTAVYMSDLDYLMEVFTRLKSVEVEYKELKAKMTTRSGELLKQDADTMRCCGCAQRAQRAELSLLALQYRMCQQHCWRCYYNTVEGDWFRPGPKAMDKYRSGSLPVPAKLASVLKTLEYDYNEMRHKILAGVTLDQLKPLSVFYTLGTESCYVPAQIAADTLGNVPTSSSQQSQRQDCKVVGGNGNVHVGIFKSSQEKKDPAPKIKVDRRTGGCVETLLPERSGTGSGPGDGQTCELQAMNTSEAWYDAEEDLDPSAERKTTKENKDVTTGQEKENGSLLQISNLLCTEFLRSIPPVCVVPTAGCTFVPQHYGTMASYDTLIARLKERHPGTESKAIVGALKELRRKHENAVLRGLPLREIENMASELLLARSTTTPP